MRRKYKIILAAFVCLVMIAIVGSAYKMNHPARPDFLDPAKTAAYSNLIAAAKQLQGNPDLSGSSVVLAKQKSSIETQRAEFVIRNRDSFSNLERALHGPIEAPNTSYDANTLPIGDHPIVKVAAKAFVTKGEDAEGRGENKEAAEAYANALRLGVAYEHGPLINFLVGSAIERVALRPLKTIIPKLPSDELSALAKEIQTINHDRPSFSEISRREEYFGARNSSNVVQYARARFSSQGRRVAEKSRGIHVDLETQLEGTAAACACLAFARESKSPLKEIPMLIPKYLKSVPIDPHSSAPMKILSLQTGAVIYSVGPNERDEQGRGDDIAFFFGDAPAQR